MSLNQATIVGRVGRDPESKFTSSGTQVVNLSIATDERWKDKNGEKQTKTEWHRITLWSKLAEITQQYVTKGMLVAIVGRIETRKWQDKEGVMRYSTEIVANTMRMLGGGTKRSESTPDEDFEAPGGERVGNPPARPDTSTGTTGSDFDDSDIPF